MIGATFTADFSSIEKGTRSVGVAFKDLTITAQSAQKAVSQFGNNFSGRKILTDANAAVAAVRDLGGATKLTAAEQSKLNSTLTEALAKYEALGQKAPADMIALAKATERAESSLEGFDGSAAASLQGFRGATESSASSLVSLGTVGLSAVGGLAAAFTAAASHVIDFGGHLTDLKEQTGISTDGLQTLGAVGKTVGLSIDDIANAVGQMSKRLAGGDDGAVAAVQSLGLNVKDLIALAPDAAFERLASAVGQVENPMDRVRLATELLGKAGEQALPLLNDKLHELREAAHDSGQVINAETVKAMDDLGDAWTNLKTTGAVLIADVLSPMLPLLKHLAEAASSWSAALHQDIADQTSAITEAWARIKQVGADIPGFFTQLQVSAYSGFGSVSTSAEAATQSTTALTTATKGTIDSVTLASNRLKAMQAEALAPLSAAQQSLIRQFQGFGVSAKDIADLVGSNVLAVNRYEDAIKRSADASKTAREESERYREELAAVVGDVQKVNDAIGKMFDKDAEEAAKREAEALKQFTDAVNGMTGQTGLEKALFDLDALNAAIAQGGATIEAKKSVYNDLEAAIEAVTIGGAKLSGTTEEQTAAFNRLVLAAARLGSELSQMEGPLKNIIKRNVELAAMNPFGEMLKEAKQAEAAVDDLSRAFEKFAERMPDILIQGILHGSGAGDIAAALGTELGADLGESIGTAIGGPIGGAIGKSLGSLLGPLLKHLFHDRAAEEIGSIGYEFGVRVSKDFAQGIEDQAKADFGGNRQATKIFDLDQIISQGGGITSKNLDLLTARLHDVYSMIETGAFTADQAQSVLDKNFQGFVDFLGGKVSPALKEIIRLNDQFGTHSKSIAQYVDAQATTALDSLSKVVAQRQSALDALNNAKSPDEIAKAQAKLNALPLTKTSGAAFGGALFGIFDRLQKDGVSAIDTLKQIDPVIESLDKQFAQAGIAGGSAFDRIKSLAGIATDEIAGPSFEAIQNYGAALEALNNADILDQEQFTGLTDQITATYNAAVDALVKEGKDGSAALGLVSPQLQEIWELQQDFGYAVDDSTQKLLDQAEAAGTVGEKHRSVQEQTLDVMKHLDDVLTGIGKKFGVDIPADVDKTGQAFQDAQRDMETWLKQVPDQINIPVNADFSTNEDSQRGPTDQHDTSHPYARGAWISDRDVLYAASGRWVNWMPRGTDVVPAMLTPNEAVLNTGAAARTGRAAVEWANGGGTLVPAGSGGGGGVTIVLPPGSVVLNGQPSESERQALAKELMVLGPKIVANGGTAYTEWARMVKHMAEVH